VRSMGLGLGRHGFASGKGIKCTEVQEGMDKR